MKEPLISIIIPVYNRAELIKETLDSVLQQTYQNWECIVVDDGSSDNTWQVLLNYAEKDNRIKNFQRARFPKGAPTCRNFGMDLAKGKYLIFLDSDDLMAPWALETRIKIIKNSPKLDMVLSNGIYFNRIKRDFVHYTTEFGCESIIEYYRKFKMVLQTSAVTWNKSFLMKKFLHWDEELTSWQDTDLFIRSFSLNPKFSWADEIPDYFARQENDRFAITSSSNIVEKTINNFITYEKWLKNKQNENELRHYFPTFMLFKVEYFMTNSEIKSLVNEIGSKLLTHFKKGIILYLWLYRKSRNIPILKGVVYKLRYLLTGAKKRGFGIEKEKLSLNNLDILQKKYFETTGKNLNEFLWEKNL
jgi:glycosyltransferase involved in cell wall biosynthesis